MDFSDFLGALDDGEFSERPVDMNTFLYSKDFMGLPPLSKYQEEIVEVGSQIYKKETLIKLYGAEEGNRLHKVTKKELILTLGKGCHAPYTPVFDAVTGRWKRLDSFRGSQNTIVGLNSFGDAVQQPATWAFAEGVGEMVRVTTQLGFVEDVYVGHKYYSWLKKDFYKRSDRPELAQRGLGMREVKDLEVGDRVAIGINFDVQSPEPLESGALTLIAYWLSDGSSCANDKFIPDQVWSCANDQLGLFLAALWSIDGSVYLKKSLGETDMPIAEYCSISKTLAEDVQKMLLRLGVPASIRFKIPSYTYTGTEKQGQKAWVVEIESSEIFTAFYNSVGRHLCGHKLELNESLVAFTEKTGRKYKRLDGDIYWDSIKSIEPLGSGEYWTITAMDTANYIGNGMISSNSGKDMVSAVTCCYIVYKLLCLKDPAAYYGKPKDDNIDIVNVAVNADHAKKVFFSGLKNRIKNCPWFAGKYIDREKDIEFKKSVRVHSLNSEGSSSDGMNCLAIIFDEGDDFDKGDESPNADAMYKVLSANVSSRFADIGKLILLSYPRTKNGFMMKKYKEAIAEKNVVLRTHTFILNPELPENHPGNSFEIQWEEDHIISYKFGNVWALRRPTWEVNPTKKIDDFVMDFHRDVSDALGRFACCPPDYAEGGWYRDKEKIDATFAGKNGITEVTGPTEITLTPDKSKQYYIHVDLARVQDNCAVSMAHVESFKSAVFDMKGEISPSVVVDVCRYWKPDRSRPIDFADVREFIINLNRAGFNIRRVTFDRWQSDGIIEHLNTVGIPAEKLSVGRDHYAEFALLMGQNMVQGPDIELLRSELKNLVVLPNGNVDHTNKSSKDLSDAVVGAVYNAATLTPRDNIDLEVVTYADIIKQNRERQEVERAKVEMPAEIADFLSQIRLW